MENTDIWIKIASVAMTGIGTLMLIMMKLIFDELKDIKKTQIEHGNRLTAIETSLKMFEWFELKKSKVEGV